MTALLMVSFFGPASMNLLRGPETIAIPIAKRLRPTEIILA
jgi:hypothetical protein